jgi:hypothetical protein
MGHLVGAPSREQHVEVLFWRRQPPTPELPRTKRDVQVMLETLFDIKLLAASIWAEVTGEGDGENGP